jgi:Transglutaminase-like superfamily
MRSEYLGQHPTFGRFRVWDQTQWGSDDDRTRQTVKRMAYNVRKAVPSPEVGNAVAAAVRHLPWDASDREVFDAVFNWIGSNVRFRNDPPYDELLLEPELLLSLRNPAGDCDDYSQLAGAMLGRLGYPSRIVTVKADQRQPDRWSHVYLDAYDSFGHRVPFDSSHGPEVGWEAPVHFGRAEWEGYDVTLNLSPRGGTWGMQGLGFDWGPVVTSGLTVGVDIGKAFAQRIAAPPGTYIQTPEGGVISRGAPQSTPILPSLNIGGGADILPWLLIAGGLVAGLAVLKR